MANPQKGEVIVNVDGGEYVLVYTLGALSAIEGQFDGKSFQTVLGELDGENVSAHAVIVVVWAGLKKHHGLTLEEVGDLVTLVDLAMWSQKVGEAFKLAQPETGKGKGKGPRKAATV